MKTVQSEGGFTLIEVLIAMAILSIGIFAVFAMQLRSTRGNTKANRLTEASTWNVAQLEQLIGSQYVAITNGTSVSPDGRYGITWTVCENIPANSCYDISLPRNIKRITCTVSDNNNFVPDMTYTYTKAQL